MNKVINIGNEKFNINECIKKDFDSVTFQNHTRDGFDNHKKKLQIKDELNFF